MQGASHEPIHVRVGDGRRVVLPNSLCDQIGLRQGDEVVLEIDGPAIRLVPHAQRLREAKAFFRALAEPGRLLSEELIAERRREAELD